MHLYVHIPFCHHICPYCGFYKHTPGKLANEAFVNAILAEAKQRSQEYPIVPKTIFFGGGTPSLLSARHLETLCRGLGDLFDLSHLGEWALEANPATYDLAKASHIRSLGINRISLGVQSFQAETLKTLGRDHSPADAIAAVETLKKTGFGNISIDLMFSIPGQTRTQWRADLKQAIALDPQHISAYNLTYEEDTEFLTRHEAGELDADEDRDATLFYDAIDTLEAAGYQQYEISNYARPGYESQHNQGYWAGNDYLGLGPSAVSTIGKQRWKTLPDTAAYTKAASAGFDTRTDIEILTDADKRLERLALELRTREGVSIGLGLPLNRIKSLTQQGLIQESDGRIKLTHAGKALADPIAAELA